MFSDLKRLEKYFLVLAIFFLVLDIFFVPYLYEQAHIVLREGEIFWFIEDIKNFLLYISPWLAPVIIFFCLSISVKNIGEEMEAKYSTIYKERNDLEHQVKELEKRIKKLELEKEE